MKQGLKQGIVPAYLLLCLLLGGASAAGYFANVLLQLLAIGLIFAALIARPEGPPGQPSRQLIALIVLLVLMVLVQLIPLPPALWTALPGRDHVREGFELLDQPLPWLPISLAPARSLASLLWLLPAIAVVLAILRLGAYKAAWIGWTIAIATGLSVLVGAFQVAGGQDSFWYFYRITNYGVTVGFFANANHLATLLLVCVPFLAGLYMSARRKRSVQKSGSLILILLGFYGLVLIGLIINRSLAGIGLMLPVTGASILLMLQNRRVPRPAMLIVLLMTAASLFAVFSGRFDDQLTGTEAQTSVVSRYTNVTNSARAAADYFPFGSGVGTFQEVYRMYEDPTRVTRTYTNHVHSDWVEVVLETGLLGILLMLLFLLWWARRTLAIWRTPAPDYLARAATVATAAIMAHSLVDYPLRTAAISAIFAACCALMANPRANAKVPAYTRPHKRPARHLTAD